MAVGVMMGSSIDPADSSASWTTYQLTVPCMIQPRFGAGVAFDQDVLEYLRRLCEEFQRDRSFIINAIVREHAKRNLERVKKPERAIRF